MSENITRLIVKWFSLSWWYLKTHYQNIQNLNYHQIDYQQIITDLVNVTVNLTEIKLCKISPDWTDRFSLIWCILFDFLTDLVKCEISPELFFSPEWSINHQNDLAFTHLSKLVNITRLSILLRQTTNKGEYHQNDPTDFH